MKTGMFRVAPPFKKFPPRQEKFIPSIVTRDKNI